MFHEYIRSTFSAIAVDNGGEKEYYRITFVEGSTDEVVLRSSFTTTSTATNFLRGLQQNGSTTTSTKVDEAYYTSQIRQEKDDISSNLTLQGKIIVGIVFMILLFILLGLFHWYFNHKYSQETERAISTYVEARSDSRTAQIALEEDAVVVKRRLRLIKQVDKQKFYVKECDILTEEELSNYLKQVDLQQQQQQQEKKHSPTKTTITLSTSLKKESNGGSSSSTYWSSFSTNRTTKKKATSKDITISTSTSSLTSLNEDEENEEECNNNHNNNNNTNDALTTTTAAVETDASSTPTSTPATATSPTTTTTTTNNNETTPTATTTPKKKMNGTHRTGERDVFQDAFRIDCCTSSSSLGNASSKSFDGNGSDSSSVTIDTYLLLPSSPNTTTSSISTNKKQLVVSKQTSSKKQLLTSTRSEQQQQHQHDVVVAPVIVVQQPRRYVRNCCSICLGSYVKNDQVVWSSNPNCSHVFHYDCIMRWLCQRDENLCPMCRRVYVKMPGMNGNGSKKKLTTENGVGNNASDDNDEENDSFDDDDDDDNNDDEYYYYDDNEPLSWNDNDDNENIHNDNEQYVHEEEEENDDIEQSGVATASAAAATRNARRTAIQGLGRARSEGHMLQRRVSFAQSMAAVTDADDITYIDESSRIGEHNPNSLRSELTSYIGNDSHRSHSSIIMNLESDESNNDDDDDDIIDDDKGTRNCERRRSL